MGKLKIDGNQTTNQLKYLQANVFRDLVFIASIQNYSIDDYLRVYIDVYIYMYANMQIYIHQCIMYLAAAQCVIILNYTYQQPKNDIIWLLVTLNVNVPQRKREGLILAYSCRVD